MKKILILSFCVLFCGLVFSWNAAGHRLIAQIALDHLSSHAKERFTRYNHAADRVYKSRDLIEASVWLDTLRYKDVAWYDGLHFIDQPFSDDGTDLSTPSDHNAVWAIEKATKLILNPYASKFDKGIALRILLHVVGDLHQPLHAATEVSASLPQGDKGGNLKPLIGVRGIKNLHSYWDTGAGLLQSKHLNIRKRSLEIEQQWPCDLKTVSLNPRDWAKESYHIALSTAYHPLPKSQVPNKAYERLVKKQIIQSIALAGCRLAGLLNQLDHNRPEARD